MGSEDYATQVGEQRLVVLDDGSRMTLNTNTRVHVSLGSKQRSVEVQQGEALFEVAKDPQRPFVVHAGGSEVVAVGTVFAVRLAQGGYSGNQGDHGDLGDPGARLPDALTVMLVEGRVSLRADPSAWPSSWPSTWPSSWSSPLSSLWSSSRSKGLSPDRPILMTAGERVRLSKATAKTTGHTTLQVDMPRIDRVLAWERSEAVFDDVPLSDAVAEMNRYSRTPIALSGDEALAQLRISGQYHTGDNLSFAKAVSTLHGLSLQEREGRLELSLPH